MKISKKIKKRLLCSAVAVVTVVTSISVPQGSNKVLAEDVDVDLEPSSSAYQEDVLKMSKYSKVYFGDMFNKDTQHRWYVAGELNGKLVLLCDPKTDYGKCVFDGSNVLDSKRTNYYPSSKLCSYVTSLYYGDNKKFSDAEVNLMDDVDFDTPCSYSNVYDGDRTSVIAKMYIANAKYSSNTKWDKDNIYVGYADGSIGLSLDMIKRDVPFWLRAPRASWKYLALCASVFDGVWGLDVCNEYKVVPVFHMNSSSVLFSSTVSQANKDCCGVFDNDGVSTLRFASDKNANGEKVTDRIKGKATASKYGISVANPSSDEYLCVQWREGNKDKAFTCASKSIVSADEIGGKGFLLSSGCKIWLEKKDSKDNLIYAKKADFIDHTHNWTYTTKDGNKLCAYCSDGCLWEAVSLDSAKTLTVSVLDKKNFCQGVPNVRIGTDQERKAWEMMGLEIPKEYVLRDSSGVAVADNKPTVAGTYSVEVSAGSAKTAIPINVREIPKLVDAYGNEIGQYSKVYFGGKYDEKINHRWYVAGIEDGALVLLCDSSTSYGKSNYDGNGLLDTSRSNNYADSDLDKAIVNLYNKENKGNFTQAEINLMNDVSIDYTWNRLLHDAEKKTITRKMYAASGKYDSLCERDLKNIYVGKDEGAIKLDLSKIMGNKFWLRTPVKDTSCNALYAMSGIDILGCRILEDLVLSSDTFIDEFEIAPVLHMDMEDVLFASSAEPSKEGAKLDESNVMTIRYDAKDRIKSSAIASPKGITIKNPTDGEYLYIEWKKDGKDTVQSIALNPNKTFYKDEIPKIDENCRVWIEKKDLKENLVYAKSIDFTPHEHEWTYLAENDKIWVYCSGEKCDLNADIDHKLSLTLQVESKEYSSKPLKATVGTEEEISAWKEALGEDSIPEVKFYKVGDSKSLEKAPTDIGEYVAKISPVGIEATDSNTALVNCKIAEKRLVDVYGEEIDSNSLDKYAKVYFGDKYNNNTYHRWYIAGKEDGDLVLLCDPSTSYGCGPYDKSTNIYGNSLLDEYLQSLYSEDSTKFTEAEKNIMKNVEIGYANDCDRPSTSISKVYRKMYIPNVRYTDSTVWDRNNLYIGKDNGLLAMDLDKINVCGGFWLRAPLFSRSGYALSVYSGAYVECKAIMGDRLVVPAMHIDMADILFASSVQPAKKNAQNDSNGVMTIRYDGDDKICSLATVGDGEIVVDNATKGEYLYIQWKEGDKDKVKSFALEDGISSYKNDLLESMADCKIWIEKKDKEDNLVYAKMVN